MKKDIKFKISGHPAQVGEISINRLLPNQYAHHVGHFVFLDHFPPFFRDSKMLPNTGFAHPHRGIATLTYIINGEAEHYDSSGNHSKIHSGGVQWMKAGNGIIHDEAVNADSRTTGKLIHGFQFWINLPSAIKKENPDYLALEANELPIVDLENNSGTLKIIVGEYNGLASKIPTYAKQFLFHIRINAGKKFTLPTVEGFEYAVFLPQHEININDKNYFEGNLIGFEDDGNLIEFENKLEIVADLILFGGEKYTESFVAHGPFVMNTREEIQTAFIDFQMGKYGNINYN